MNRLRGILMFSMAAAVLACVAVPANAGLFHKHADDCCCEADPCCAPAPVCCAPEPVCCPAPPADVQVKWCVVDPCTGCKYSVSACVPACCAGVEPCLDGSRKGIFGRKVLTYKFACCNHCVDVVITKRGRTIVRD